MATIDEIQAKRDEAVANRSAIQQQQTQAQNAYTASAGRPDQFMSTFKDRMRSRFNQRSAARQQQQQAVGKAETAGSNSLAATEGSGMSVAGRVAAANNATSMANQGILDAENSVAYKMGNVTDVAQAIVAGMEAERNRRAAEVDALNQQYAQANDMAKEYQTMYDNEQARLDRLRLSGGSAQPKADLTKVFALQRAIADSDKKRQQIGGINSAIQGGANFLSKLPVVGKLFNFQNAPQLPTAQLPTADALTAAALQGQNYNTQAALLDTYQNSLPEPGYVLDINGNTIGGLTGSEAASILQNDQKVTDKQQESASQRQLISDLVDDVRNKRLKQYELYAAYPEIDRNTINDVWAAYEDK